MSRPREVITYLGSCSVGIYYLWYLLLTQSALHQITDAYSPDTDRYNTSAFFHANSANRLNVIPTKGGHFLKEDPYLFDAAFFNISGAESAALDLRQRMALEVAYEAIENAGLAPRRLSGTRTACFMGSTLSDYRDSVIRDFAHNPKHYLVGMTEEMISNRISHFFDLHGPSATVATACSSSLVTIHMACQSLRNGESDVCSNSPFSCTCRLFLLGGFAMSKQLLLGMENEQKCSGIVSQINYWQPLTLERLRRLLLGASTSH